jgi:iron complex outermembrane receptor protein
VIANLGLKFNPTQNFQFALMNQYVGKQYLDNSEDENLQLKDYFLTDFNAQYQFKIKNNDIALKLLVNNLFNKKYVNNGAVYDGSPYYFSQAGTNFMFGISWKIQ